MALHEHALELVPERGWATRPVLEPSRITLAAQDVMRFDAPALVGPNRLYPSQCLALNRRRICELGVGRQDKDTMLVEELLTDRGHILNTAEALCGVHENQ